MRQISKTQLSILFINILIPTAHVQVLLTTIQEAKRDAWLYRCSFNFTSLLRIN